ncbi:transporter [Aquimarina sp. U1-2]|uniref:transporter n=1 Tax=Aquimarina sp. U1-2 TaxID=2823141 RepID=UPI001AECA5D2|nr:transporter [Aquimarina sp. U1-2]MBP2832740.1 transporter [Aquimarina sp. U1-2]
MSPKSILLLVSIFLLGVTASAQYTDKINSNRPGTSQGAFSVGNNVLQIEGGFGFGKEKHNIFNTKTNVFNFDYAVRYGLLIEQLEIRLNGRFRADGVRQVVGANEQKINRSDFEVNTLGAKYLIYDPYKKPKKEDSTYASLKSWKEHHRFKWKTLIPAVSAYAGVNFISSDNPFTFPEDQSISPIFVIATQNNWTTNYGGNWAFVTNIIIDKITTENPALGLILTATHTINDKWAGFLEYQVQKSDFYSDNIMRLGGAYLFDKDLQFDTNLAFNFKDTPSVWTLSFGASYRFDWHSKDEIIEQPGLEGGVKEEDIEENEENEGEEDIEGTFEEFEENETDSLKSGKTPFINDFEDDGFREELERDLDEKRTEERLERERIEQEKIDKKEGKKFKKEEARRLKREAKEAREAEKAALKAEKEKAKMIEDIDAELDKMEQDKGVDQELEDLDRQLKELEKMEQDLDIENKPKPEDQSKEEKEQKKEEKEQKKEEIDIDAQYDEYQKEQESIKKAEDKRRKKEDKKRLKEEKKRKREAEKIKRNKEKDPNIDKEIEKELEDF